jgi:hypothetical protein
MDHYFHCVWGNTQIHENFGYTLNHRFGVFLPKTFPHVHMNDWHFAPPNVSLAIGYSSAAQLLDLLLNDLKENQSCPYHTENSIAHIAKPQEPLYPLVNPVLPKEFCAGILAVTDGRTYMIFLLERTILETVEIGKYQSEVFPTGRSLETHPAGIHLDSHSLKEVNFVGQ